MRHSSSQANAGQEAIASLILHRYSKGKHPQLNQTDCDRPNSGC
ncbi:hypothetical protein [Phormidium yuhuli]|nr:hypothetical protein [Phormidium yuhuli]